MQTNRIGQEEPRQDQWQPRKRAGAAVKPKKEAVITQLQTRNPIEDAQNRQAKKLKRLSQARARARGVIAAEPGGQREGKLRRQWCVDRAGAKKMQADSAKTRAGAVRALGSWVKSGMIEQVKSPPRKNQRIRGMTGGSSQVEGKGKINRPRTNQVKPMKQKQKLSGQANCSGDEI